MGSILLVQGGSLLLGQMAQFYFAIVIMLTEIIGRRTQIKWAETLDKATLQMMQQQVADELSGLFAMNTNEWNQRYLTKGLLLGQVNKEELQIDLKEVLGERTYQYMKSENLKQLLTAFKELENKAEPQIKQSIAKTGRNNWFRRNK
jgi:hypothetical protein